MFIPTVGMKGAFKFDSPFDTGDIQDRVLEVASLRSLQELYQDGVDPLKRIYLDNGLKESEYEEDLKNKVPVAVLKTEGNRLYYVPCNKIIGAPITTGIIYKRFVVHVNLGNLPEDYPLTPMLEEIENTIKNYTGIKGKVEVVPTSEKILISDDEHNTFTSKLATTSKARNDKSYAVQIAELENKYNAINKDYKALQDFMSKTWSNNVTQVTPSPSVKDLYVSKIYIDVVSPEGLDYKAAIGGITLYRRNSFNLNPVPIYAVGLQRTLDPKKSYTGLMDKTKFRVSLEKGDIGLQPLINVFSDNYNIKFESDPKDNTSRGSISILLEEPVNIRDFEIKLAFSKSYNCSRCRVVMRNIDGLIIFNNTFEKDKDFNEEEGLGKSQIVKAEDIVLSMNLPQMEQSKLPELVSVHP